MTGSRAGLAQHPGYPGLSPPPAAAQPVTHSSASQQAIDVSDGQIPCRVFHTDELAATCQSSNLLHLLRKETIVPSSSLQGFLYAAPDCALNESRNQFAASQPQLNQTYSQFLLSKKHPMLLLSTHCHFNKILQNLGQSYTVRNV